MQKFHFALLLTQSGEGEEMDSCLSQQVLAQSEMQKVTSGTNF